MTVTAPVTQNSEESFKARTKTMQADIDKLKADNAALTQQLARYAAALNAIQATIQLVAQPNQ